MSSCCNTLGQPNNSVSATYGCFKNAGICDLKSNVANITELTTNNITTNNLTVLNAFTPQPYVLQQASLPIAPINLNPGATILLSGNSSPGLSFVSSSNITVNANSWTINTTGDYVLDISLSVFSNVPTGLAGQPTYLGFNIPVNVNAVPVFTCTDNESIIGIPTSTENFIVPFHFMVPLNLAVGDVIDLTIASTLPITPPSQSLLSCGIKLQKIS